MSQPGAMAAIMDIEGARLEEICTLCDVEVANVNCPEQIIITGREEPVAKAMAMSEAAGAKKCVKLNVSGPWHSRCMTLARDQFEPYIRQCTFKDPLFTVVNNVDAEPLKRGADAAEKLVQQICGSVLWSQSMERLIQDGHTHFVEVGPKKVLRGLMRRINRSAKVLNVEDPESLAAFLQANR
jgi:[acyl-carrier-protein] S-malonyltransferase